MVSPQARQLGSDPPLPEGSRFLPLAGSLAPPSIASRHIPEICVPVPSVLATPRLTFPHSPERPHSSSALLGTEDLILMKFYDMCKVQENLHMSHFQKGSPNQCLRVRNASPNEEPTLVKANTYGTFTMCWALMNI